MKPWHRSATLLLVFTAACGALPEDGSAGGQDLAPAVLSAAPLAALSHTLPRGGQSTLSLRTLPNAACTLRPASEAPGSRRHLRVYADDQGIARIVLQDRGGQDTPAQLALDCADEGGHSFTHAISVSVGDHVRPQAPARAPTTGRPTLPALEVNPLALTPAEIAARGYPPRPDPRTAPAQYRKWLALLARRPVVLAPHRVADPGRTHGPPHVADGSGASDNWSGYVIATGGAAPQYGEIFGAWPVPRAFAQGGFWHLDYSSLWVGIDGWGTPDVVQAGTDQDTETIFFVQASSYGAWTEWYPLNSQSISNFPVNPGDEIYTWVWVGDSRGAWTPSGGVGWFLLYNASENVITGYLSTAAPAGTTFNGHQAEWVMERPTVNGSLSTLANYGSAQISDAWAYDFADQAHEYTSDESVAIGMYGGSGLLSSVAPLDPYAMQFTWHGYN